MENQHMLPRRSTLYGFRFPRGSPHSPSVIEIFRFSNLYHRISWIGENVKKIVNKDKIYGE